MKIFNKWTVILSFYTPNADDASRVKNLLTDNPKLFGDMPIGGGMHAGKHPAYTTTVKDRLNDILNNTNFSEAQQKSMVLDLQRGLREVLIDGNPDLLNAGNFNLAAMDNALNSKNVLSLDDFVLEGDKYTLSESSTNKGKKASKLVQDFENDAGKTITQAFDPGTRSTDGFAKHHGEKFRAALLKLDDAAPFTSLSTHVINNKQRML